MKDVTVGLPEHVWVSWLDPECSESLFAQKAVVRLIK